jgi:steroid 5-alpha reductase family enzyme
VRFDQFITGNLKIFFFSYNRFIEFFDRKTKVYVCNKGFAGMLQWIISHRFCFSTGSYRPVRITLLLEKFFSAHFFKNLAQNKLLCFQIKYRIMTFTEIFLWAFPVIMILMTAVWIVSVYMKNAGIVDPFWGLGFVLAAVYYFVQSPGFETRKLIVLLLVAIWGLRLSVYLFWRNAGKGEDYRYQNFRQSYGDHRYWWVSFFQVFLLQGVLMWLVSAPLLGAMYYAHHNEIGVIDFIAILVWIIGFSFEAGGDYQLARFKSKPENKGKVMRSGFWKYTRHPNYFGDSAVWWSYALFSVAAGSYIPVLGAILMTLLIIKVSGVALLEKSLKDKKPDYIDYARKTNAFFPWFPKK